MARNLGLEFPPKSTTAEQLQQLINYIAELTKPCLLILDNANHEADLKENMTFLRQCDNFHILMTSRLADFEYSQKHNLGALQKPDALQLFKTHYKAMDDEEVALFDEIYEVAGGNTLVLELLAKNLRHFNNKLRKRYTFQNLLDNLQKGLTKLSQQQKVDTVYHAKGTGLRNETPEAIILAMYDLTELDDYEKQLLSIFAVLPAENIAFETLEKFENAPDLDQKLLELAKKGWIDFYEDDASFKVSSVIQEITRVKNENRLRDDVEKLIDFLQQEYEQIRTDRVKGHWLIPIIENLLKYLPKDYYLTRFQQNLTNILVDVGEIQKAENNAKNLLSTNFMFEFEGRGIQLYIMAICNLATIYMKQYKINDAVEQYKIAESWLKKIPEENSEIWRKLMSNIYHHLSLCYGTQQNLSKQEYYFNKSLELQSNYDAQTLLVLSHKYENEGNLAKAYEVISQALEDFNTPEKENSLMYATLLIRSSELILNFSDGEEISLFFLKEAEKVYQNQPVKNPDKIEFLYHQFALTYERLRKYKQALKYSQNAIDIFNLKYDENHSNFKPLNNAYQRIKNKLPKKKGKTVGRNSPCPCGSGKKYKKCCGKSK